MKVSKNFYVGFKLIDDANKIKSSELLNFFVDVAGVQSESIGDGFCASNERWILIGYNVKVYEKPAYATDFCLTTWSRNYNPVVATREFEIRSEKGELMVSALADFVRYDVAKKKLKMISDSVMQAYQSEPNSSNFDGAKLNKVTEECEYDGVTKEFVDWKWLDLNEHMNNSYYVELSERVIKKAYGVKAGDFSFDILYKKEICENTNINVYYKKISEKEYKVIIKSADDKIFHSGIRFYKD